ncbi:MAG: NAD(P)H-binding protein [Bacteroidales bacterium]|nr:NAD(P)H-binding protein [Bacteroidales bacterium]
MKALVIGATGAVGRDLIQQLLEDGSFERIDVFVRREIAVTSAQLISHVVDFDHPESWTALLTGDVLFSCLGTTIKAAGGQDAQWKVDYTYQYQAAKAARENGVSTLVLVSSVGANALSRVFYTRMKGQLDEDVQKLGFPGVFILRPPSLIRKGSDRFGEKLGVAALKALNAIGIMRSWKPMPTEEVASAMIRLAKTETTGTHIIESQNIRSV